MKNPNYRIKKFIISLLVLSFLFSNVTLPVYADKNYDDTDPVLQSFRILNSKRVDARKGNTLDMKLKVIEEGTGIVSVSVALKRQVKAGSWEYINAEFNCKTAKKEPIFTGKRKIKLRFDDYYNIRTGNYTVAGINITDANGNCSSYWREDHTKMWKRSRNSCMIIRSDYKPQKKSEKPKVKSFSIVNADHVDASKGLKVKINLEGNWKQVSRIGFGYRKKGEKDEVIRIPEECKKKRSVNMSYSISELDVGKYEATEIVLYDKNEKETSYNVKKGNLKKCNRNFVVKKTPRTPEIKNLKITETKISTPGVLEVDFETGSEKVTSLSLFFKNSKGKEKELNWSNKKGLSKGKHHIEIPVSPFWGIGTWKLKEVFANSKKDKSVLYQQDDKDFPLQNAIKDKTQKIIVSSQYKTSYYGSVGNTKTVVKKLCAMKEGETAVLDCRYSKIAKKDLFLAIAGKNKTLVFEDENVQWVFKGKKIKKSRCKNIDLTSKVKKVKGKNYGYPDESHILYMKYADNGKLPGKAEMRVNYRYLCGKYGIKKDDKLKLSYYDNGMTQLLKEKPEIAEDCYVEYQVTHNSTYLLSKTVPRLIAPWKLRAKGKKKKVVLTWGRVWGACGYKVYRSTCAKGCYQQIAVVRGNRKTFFTDRKAKVGKRYYYRVKSFSSSKKIKGSYSRRVSGRARK